GRHLSRRRDRRDLPALVRVLRAARSAAPRDVLPQPPSRMTPVLLALLVLASGPVLAQGRCDNCGRIESIRATTVKETWTPLGAMAMSAAPSDSRSQPGRVSSQYNFTTGNMVLLGAAGGAGYARRPSEYQRPRWEIR